MHWKLKALIQNAVALLPAKAAYALYYQLQRRFGDLRVPAPFIPLRYGVQLVAQLQAAGSDITDKVFFELGTGRSPMVPVALWLMGARSTFTVDRNPYLDAAVVRADLEHLHTHQDALKSLLGPALKPERLARLLALPVGDSFALSALLELCAIRYIAPADAAATALPSASVDFHFSVTTLEHIPAPDIEAILAEGARLLKPGGRFIHLLDYSDHFSHSDTRISAIHFLRWTDTQWQRYAGNRFMYANRLRHDDFLALLAGLGHEVVGCEPFVDAKVLQLLAAGHVKLDPHFVGKSPECLATTSAWITTRLAADTETQNAT